MPSLQTQEKKRLRKSAPDQNSRRSFYSCKGILDVVRAQSCLALFPDCKDISGLTAIDQDEKSTKIKPRVGFLLNDHHSNSSDESLSMYSTSEMDDQPRMRLRAKTPVFAVGQLERNSMIRQCDRAKHLAEEYQSQLPPRVFTPFCEAEIPRHRPKKLRKIKCQLSLRDLVKEDQAKCQARHSISYSDADTLVGSESPSSLSSPIEEKQKIRMLEPKSRSHVTQNYEQVVAELDHNIGLKICADLLTNELASALYRHHPEEIEGRASGLQILLMIETYETVQQHVRQKLYDAHVTGGDEKHVKMVDEILEHWLQVLYSVYDRAQDNNEVVKILPEERSLPMLAELTEYGDG
ncbi:hypothetical protein EG329_002897 [Mollisiaceae sp. DMI_Dod_QoI]|nr:hypothetical protein EG329_002897 [Helotiales sp. DMI_Dod_QoI]